jgi:hypothetical protein
LAALQQSNVRGDATRASRVVIPLAVREQTGAFERFTPVLSRAATDVLAVALKCLRDAVLPFCKQCPNKAGGLVKVVRDEGQFLKGRLSRVSIRARQLLGSPRSGAERAWLRHDALQMILETEMHILLEEIRGLDAFIESEVREGETESELRGFCRFVTRVVLRTLVTSADELSA